jgi:hypothetical protein
MYSDDIDELKAKRICFQCIGEEYLSAEIEHDGAIALCSYCGNTAKAITVEELADRVESAFEDHYTRTADQPNAWQQSLRESSYDWDRDGVPVVDAIEGAADIPSEAATDVQTILDDRYEDIEAAKIVEIAQARRRFGYRRIHDMLRPEFPGVNHKRVYRLYSQANLAVRRRKKVKRPAAERVPLQLAQGVNEVWSMDFVSDSLANGRRIKFLTVADDFSHECVELYVTRSPFRPCAQAAPACP